MNNVKKNCKPLKRPSNICNSTTGSRASRDFPARASCWACSATRRKSSNSSTSRAQTARVQYRCDARLRAPKRGVPHGLYTSPHLLRFHERMRVNGEEIDDDSLISLTKHRAERSGAHERNAHGL